VAADPDTLATALHAKADDVMETHSGLVRWRPEAGSAPMLSDAEQVTRSVIQAFLGLMN